MALFGNLDQYLSGPPSIAPILDSPTFLDFDQSYDDEGNDVLLSSKDDKKNRTEPKVDGQPKKFIAQKGQKTTVKKLEKIQADLTKNLVQNSSMDFIKNDVVSIDLINQPTIRNRRKRKQQVTACNGPGNISNIIDLVNSPVLEIPGVVSLDSDDEIEAFREEANKAGSTPILDCGTINITVKCGTDIQKYTYSRHKNFSELAELIAAKRSVNSSCVLLLFKEKPVAHDTTPHRIGYIPGLIMYASILDITELQPQTKKRKNANEIKLKIQSAGCRKIREVYIDKTDKLEVLVLTCAEQLKCDPNTIKLNFDGESLDITQSPEYYDMEGGEIIDVHCK